MAIFFLPVCIRCSTASKAACSSFIIICVQGILLDTLSNNTNGMRSAAAIIF